MKNRIEFALLFFVLAHVLIGCSKSPDAQVSKSEKQFATAVPITDMNNSLSLIVDSNQQSFASDTDIPIILKNKSSQHIVFDENSHVKLLINTDNQWTEIKNGITYSGAMTLSPSDVLIFNEQYTWVRPLLDGFDFGERNSPVPLRIVITGEMMDGDVPTGNKVGTYVDVLLELTKQPTPTEVVLYSTDETIASDKGRIEGIILSAEESGKPLPNVTIQLMYHPLFSGSSQTTPIATTKTDTKGRFSFQDVEPGIYALQTIILLEQGGSCGGFDLSKIIKIDPGVIATLSLSLTC